ncbi:MAG: Oxidoreductase [Candidatus Jorgensenbacteria bacterium GW2011_GWA2_45_13]|uniref:Oxidoreductase n=1 Tax=Candidatus Jorgensenbacteria bacterium GW2011_GWA2_45_13 TaxID=1618662 RepID=A0A0G1NCK8_9BACT|nr:MAG: Oxidoreductase [Candidatus Jorgensenbacteria bacterium GW2011_GWA2_45_13]
MKQVFQNPKSGETRLEEITPPMAPSKGVLVQNRFSVISAGTERGIIELSKKSLFEKAKERPDYVRKFFMLIKTKGFKWAWGVAQAKLGKDIALGYSSAGIVIGAGREVEEFRAGDRVACAGQDYASHAEVIAVPKNLCVKIPENVSEKEAAFATIAAIAMQGIRQANLTPGEKVGVVGLGLLGQLSTRMLRAYGHPVIGFDVNSEQVKFALENGMDEGVALGMGDPELSVKKFTDGRGVDATLSYISSRSYGPGRYDPSFEEGGNDYPLGHVRWTERRNMEEFLRLLSDGSVDIKNLITKTFSIDEAKEAYDLVFRPEGLVHGIVLEYPEEKKHAHRIEFEKSVAEPAKQKEVGVGLIGLGSFMKSEILPHLKKTEGARVIGVAHTHGLDAKATAEEWGAEYVTNDYHDILNDKNIDLVICATRHSNHAKIAVEALRAGKNLHMEKPLALNEEELIAVMEEAKHSKGRLFVGFNRRFSEHFVRVKELFADSQTPLQMLYRINYALEEHWSHDQKEGGRLIGEACHFVDALAYLSGSKPVRVTAASVPVGGAVPHEENFAFTVEFENGSIGTVVYGGLGNFRLPKEYIEIYGNGNIFVIDNFKEGKFITPTKITKYNLRHQHKGYLEELQVQIDAIRGGLPSPMSLEEIYASHLGIIKVAEAIKTGGAAEVQY